MFAKEGLEGVVAARTGLSRIDGEQGYLGYRGYAIRGPLVSVPAR